MLTFAQLSIMRKVVMDSFATPSDGDARNRAERSLRLRMITSPAYEDVALDDAELWAERGARSHARYLHGFLFFTDWFGTILQDEPTRIEASRQALDIIRSWHNGPARLGISHTQAFHDETTAQRLIKLVRIYPYLTANLPENDTRFIRPLMEQTAELLADSQFHSAGNNHGMFQDLALLYYAILSDWLMNSDRDRHLTLALRRLKEYFSSCFTSEGVHVENTPTYHIMVSRNLALVQRIVEAAGHSDSKYYSELLTNAEKYATHALMPNGLYPPISDTQQTRVNGPRVLRVFRSKEFLYASTLGKQGRAPKEKVLVLPKTGYAIYRSSWGDPNATYAFFSAAYNSGYHKHSDDLSLYLRSMGIDLLSESGPYGYDYKHPFSRYAYSQFSHNSLVVDGKSLPRTDGHRSAVTLRSISTDSQGMAVQGSNSRYTDTTHKRTISINDSHEKPSISITDVIESETDHSYQLLWHLGPEVRAVLHEDGLELFHGPKKVMDMVIAADVPIQISLVRGRMKPRPLGWSFPKFGEAVPTEVMLVRFSGTNARIETAIRLADFSSRDRGITPRVNSKLPLIPHEVLTNKALKQIILRIHPEPGILISCKLYTGSTLIASTGYTRTSEIAFSDLAPGVYRVRVTSRQQGSKSRSSFTTRRLVLEKP